MNEAKLNEFIGRFMSDAAASLNVLMVSVGDRLGFYKAMLGLGHPTTPEELATVAASNPRMTKEWLSSQAANGYVVYDPKTQTFSLPEEHALVLAVEQSPVYLQGGVGTNVSLYKDDDKIVQAMKTGKGLGWGDHRPEFYEAQEKLTAITYNFNLIQSWIPALGGMEEKLQRGAKVADIGSGRGHALSLMARNYPNSTFVGYDADRSSIEGARKKLTGDQGAPLNNLRFEVADATKYPVEDYDLILFLSCLHDMADPSGALSHAYESLRVKQGTLMVTEAPAGDKLEENFNPFGRLLYSVSTMECVPASLNGNGPGLGTLVGETKLRELVTSSGFKNFRRVAETPPLTNVYAASAI